MGEWVERRWQGNPSGQVKRERESGVYRAWSPDLLSKLDKRLTKTTYDALVDANDSLRQAQLSVRSHGFESLARLLLRSEWLASSYIEGLAVGSRRLLSTEFDNDDRDHVAREILGNIEAVEGAVELASKAAAISKAGLLAVHVQLMSRSPNPDWGGVVRTSQNWVGGNPYNPFGADYVPPPPDDVSHLMDDLITYLNSEVDHPVMQAAIAHAQLETIHPFGDGNGRIGRALIHMVLTRRGLAASPVVPISLALAVNVDRYVTGLVDFREGHLDEWFEYFAAATSWSADRMVRIGEDLSMREQRWIAMAGNPRAHSTELKVIRDLGGHPILNTVTVSDRFGVSNEAARKALMGLEQAGILRQFTTRSRNRVWGAVEVFKLLDDLQQELHTPSTVSSGAESDDDSGTTL